VEGGGPPPVLDRRTFGALKSKGRAKWRTCFDGHGGARRARETGAALLLASRDGLPESRISAGSDFGESPEENEQEPDESDDDFELPMATSSEDEDTNIPADEDAVELPPGGQRAKRQ
jgi:hypothetical protein